MWTWALEMTGRLPVAKQSTLSNVRWVGDTALKEVGSTDTNMLESGVLAWLCWHLVLHLYNMTIMQVENYYLYDLSQDRDSVSFSRPRDVRLGSM